MLRKEEDSPLWTREPDLFVGGLLVEDVGAVVSQPDRQDSRLSAHGSLVPWSVFFSHPGVGLLSHSSRLDSTHRVLDVVRGGLVRVDRLDRLLEILGQPVHSLVRDIVVLAVGQLAVRVTWAGVSLRAGGTTSGVTD
jgi:hypothetical protein